MALMPQEPGRLGLEREKPGPQRQSWRGQCPKCVWPREWVAPR